MRVHISHIFESDRSISKAKVSHKRRGKSKNYYINNTILDRPFKAHKGGQLLLMCANALWYLLLLCGDAQ